MPEQPSPKALELLTAAATTSPGYFLTHDPEEASLVDELRGNAYAQVHEIPQVVNISFASPFSDDPARCPLPILHKDCLIPTPAGEKYSQEHGAGLEAQAQEA